MSGGTIFLRNFSSMARDGGGPQSEREPRRFCREDISSFHSHGFGKSRIIARPGREPGSGSRRRASARSSKGFARPAVIESVANGAVSELEANVAELGRESELWQERARRLADDREKALECVRRHLAAERARAARTAELDQQRSLRSKILLDQQAVDSKLAELRTRAAALSSREARCNAQASVNSGTDVERVFDRWESRLDGVEGTIESTPSVDYFSETLTREEDHARAEAELDRILSNGKKVSL